MAMDGGQMAFALGAEYRRETADFNVNRTIVLARLPARACRARCRPTVRATSRPCSPNWSCQ
ncbi:hypothetical protein LP420_10415 [Massilia sp. B-10]|nr:hypothetical protein LP420_10415 [Massilia sp. B-10]